MKGRTAAAVLLIHLAGGTEADAYTFDSEADQDGAEPSLEVITGGR